MRSEIKVYISAKLEHAAKLRDLKVDGFHINSRWIWMADMGRSNQKPVTHWQQENFDDIEAAHYFIMYVEPGDHLKGSIFEIGYAVRADKKCWIAGDGHGVDVPIKDAGGMFPAEENGPDTIRLPHRGSVPWGFYAQQIRVVLSLDEAFKQINALHGRQMTAISGKVSDPPIFTELGPIK